jgi:hypothetical protein
MAAERQSRTRFCSFIRAIRELISRSVAAGGRRIADGGDPDTGKPDPDEAGQPAQESRIVME